jgi:hypothetical protein
MSKAKRIRDVDVNRDVLKKAASLEEFKKLNPNIFSHLADQDGAYVELYAEVNPPAAAKPAAPAASPAAQ